MRLSLTLLRDEIFKQRSIGPPHSYQQAIRSAVIQQFLILAFASMILDGGVVFALCFYAAVGFWAGFVMIHVRRPIPTTVDLAVIKVGYLPLCLISFLCAWISH